jgi:aspartyl-tRNA(Asn)/glutamyl-tRNA(Gln) amidotransferase subunit A
MDFDPAVRDRMLAGLLMPADLLLAARRVRRIVAQRARALFADFDLLLTPPRLAARRAWARPPWRLRASRFPSAPIWACSAKPISFIGLPALAVPALADTPLPIGVQMIAPAWAEARLIHCPSSHRAGITGPRPVTGPTQ